MVWSYLVRPLDYLRIQHGVKWSFDFWIPVVIVLVCVALRTYLLPKGVHILAPGGLIDGVNSLFQILIAFYIAALAAVATFPKPGMDDVMDGVPPKLRMVGPDGKRGDEVSLTRRQFLCYQFGYLSFASLFIYIVGMTGRLSNDNFIELSHKVSDWYPWIVNALTYLYVFALAHLLIVTLIGLYYLTDRIHREQPRYKPGSDASGSDHEGGSNQ